MLCLGRVRIVEEEETLERSAPEPELENKTDMTPTIETRFFKEPTHDEIALSAFLAWERDGRPHCSDQNYWLDAEQRLRAQRLKLAQTAAAKAAKPWPPQARVKAVKAKSSVPAAPAVASKTAAPKVVKSVAPAAKKPAPPTAARATSVKAVRTAKAATHPASLPARATSLRAAR